MIPLPMTLFEYFYHLDVFLGSLPLKIGLICIYWAQYSVNFIIYAGSCPQYRQAYRNLIQKVSQTKQNQNVTHFANILPVIC